MIRNPSMDIYSSSGNSVSSVGRNHDSNPNVTASVFQFSENIMTTISSVLFGLQKLNLLISFKVQIKTNQMCSSCGIRSKYSTLFFFHF